MAGKTKPCHGDRGSCPCSTKELHCSTVQIWQMMTMESNFCSPKKVKKMADKKEQIRDWKDLDSAPLLIYQEHFLTPKPHHLRIFGSHLHSLDVSLYVSLINCQVRRGVFFTYGMTQSSEKSTQMSLCSPEEEILQLYHFQKTVTHKNQPLLILFPLTRSTWETSSKFLKGSSLHMSLSEMIVSGT